MINRFILRCIWIYIDCVHIRTTHKCHKYLEVTVSFIMPFNAFGFQSNEQLRITIHRAVISLKSCLLHKYHMCIKFTCTLKLVSSVNYIMYIVIYGTLDPCCLKQSWNNNTGIISRNWNSIKLMAIDRIWLSKSSNIWLGSVAELFPWSRKNWVLWFSLKKNVLTLAWLSIMPLCNHNASSIHYRKLAWNTRIEY